MSNDVPSCPPPPPCLAAVVVAALLSSRPKPVQLSYRSLPLRSCLLLEIHPYHHALLRCSGPQSGQIDIPCLPTFTTSPYNLRNRPSQRSSPGVLFCCQDRADFTPVEALSDTTAKLLLISNCLPAIRFAANQPLRRAKELLLWANNKERLFLILRLLRLRLLCPSRIRRRLARRKS